MYLFLSIRNLHWKPPSKAVKYSSDTGP